MTDGEERPTLHLIVGPNGAGKTTFYDLQLQPLTDAAFVNADRLALDRFGHVAATLDESRTGQALAETRREALIGERRTFVAESTFSHPSKLDLLTAAKAAGYRLVVYHLNLRDPEHAVLRVRARVARGGHPVPEDRIRGRYERNQPLIRAAILQADDGYVFDSSRLGEPPDLLLIFQGGRAAQIARRLPDWAVELYGGDIA